MNITSFTENSKLKIRFIFIKNRRKGGIVKNMKTTTITSSYDEDFNKNKIMLITVNRYIKIETKQKEPSILKISKLVFEIDEQTNNNHKSDTLIKLIITKKIFKQTIK